MLLSAGERSSERARGGYDASEPANDEGEDRMIWALNDIGCLVFSSMSCVLVPYSDKEYKE